MSAEATAGGAARSGGGIGRELLLLGLALVATALATWPLARELFNFQRLADKTLDDHVYWWDFWWLRRALFVRHVDPLFCTDVFHPHGASVAASPFALPYGLLALPLQAALGDLPGAVVAVKLIGFLTFPVALLGFAKLARALGVPFWTGALAGALFAFPTFRILQLGRIHYLANALVPWFLWAGLRAREAHPVRRVALAGFLFALAGAIDASLLLEMVLAAGALFLFELRRGVRWRPALGRWLACGAVGAALLSPLLVAFFRQAASERGAEAVSRLSFDDAPDVVQRTLSPDALGLCWCTLPAITEALAFDPAERNAAELQKSSARLVADIYESLRPAQPDGLPREALVELLVLLAVVVAAATGLRQRGAVIWLALALFAFLLALGPTRAIAGHVVELPYGWLARAIPGLAAGRYPPENLRLFELALALLAALGGAASGRLRHLPVAAGAIALCAFLAAAPLRPLRFAPVALEEAEEIIARDPAPGAVLELPPRREIIMRKMALGQILHGRPLLSGPLTRVPDTAWSFFTDEPVARRWLHPPPPRPADDPALMREVAENLDALRRFDVRWIVLRHSLETVDPQAFQWLLEYVRAHGLLPQPTREGHWVVKVGPP